jgi:hypothetical protein
MRVMDYCRSGSVGKQVVFFLLDFLGDHMGMVVSPIPVKMGLSSPIRSTGLVALLIMSIARNEIGFGWGYRACWT